MKMSNLRSERLPNIWCPGCGNGIVLRSLLESVEQLGLDTDKIVVVSGIGCSSRAPAYTNFDNVHTLHGRAIPVATGIKLANPDLTVIVLTGDGDSSAIGGNHLIHAARRDVDITVIVFNNFNYGMTGGQASPLTPVASVTTTTPGGNTDRPFDLVNLTAGAGATYVARTGIYFTKHMLDHLKKAIAHRGFSLVDVIAQCPTYFGRFNRKGDAGQMIVSQKDWLVLKSVADKKSPQELAGKIVIGEFVNIPPPGPAVVPEGQV
ncbi:MAG: thiamine pyrophosphate-dependent enzyme [Caldisericota bacterium]|nr:thiamine pyrophosphate-dependent enzyme [Caldisericota bacterium]